ncbi:MAG: alpha/beta fold hydrolase [Patescibacteria group bacterium]
MILKENNLKASNGTSFGMLWGVLLVLILFLLLISLWGFYISIKPPKIVSDITPKNLELDYKEVSFITSDGITLIGWWLQNKNPVAKTLVLLHGYPADKGDVLPALAFLNKKYNLFLFDFRYLGQSAGSYSTAGAKETADLTAAIQYLKTRDIDEVGVWGFSMGGAVALMTAVRAPEIKAIISESSYARLDLMANELYRIPLLKYPLAYLTGVWAKIFLGIDLKKVSPAESAGKLHIPILIMHSKNDEVIPFKNALLIQAALKSNPKAEFWFEKDLVHGQLDSKYQKRI